MKKKLLPIIATAIIIFFGACSNEDLLPDKSQETNPETERTLSLKASMPEDITTRVALEQDGKNIELKWEVDDVLELVFVQGTAKLKSEATISTLSSDGKTANFNIDVPEGLVESVDFDLYGVYGGGGLTGADPTHLILPINAGVGSSLEDVQNRKDVVLYFESIDNNLTNDHISVSFKHLGSLFSITVMNNGIINLDELEEARLVAVNGETNWAYNSGAGGKSFDLVNGEFLDTNSPGDYISFKAENNILPAGESITFWGWYPPLPNIDWPKLKLELRSATGVLTTSGNTKDEKNVPTDAGKSYYFYAALEGSNLEFTDKSFIPTSNIFDVAVMGTLGTTVLNEDQKENIRRIKLTGELNKADFDVMKFHMPNLIYIDLSSAICEDNKLPNEAIGGAGQNKDFDPPRNNYNQKITTLILPPSLTSIGYRAFRNCNSLTGPWSSSSNLPAGLITIEEGAFHNVYGLKDPLIVPEDVTTIGKEAFHLGRFTRLKFGNKVTTIGTKAFYKCLIAGDVIIPNSVETIGAEAFNECINIDSFIFLNETPIDYTADMLPEGKTVKVPSAAAKTAYENSPGWSPRHPIEVNQ